MSLSFILLFSVLSALSFYNFSLDAIERIEFDKATLSIIKPESITNDEFLSSINSMAEQIGSDIMYRYLEIDEKTNYYYYKTNHTEDFIDAQIGKDDFILSEGESISTKQQEGYETYDLYVSNILQDITFFSLDEANIYDLSNATFYADKKDSTMLAEKITELGYNVTVNQEMHISGKMSVALFIFIPTFLMIASMIFYVLTNSKKNVLKKMEGYTTLNIIVEELTNNIKKYVIISLVIETIGLCLAGAMFKTALLQYITYHISYFLIGILVLIVGIICSFLSINTQVGIQHIKGFVPRKGIYYISIFSKCFFIVFIAFFTSIAIRNIYVAHSTYNTADVMQDKLDGYVTFPIYNHNDSLNGLTDNCLDFYNATVNTHNGIIIDASNYVYELQGGKTLNDLYNQDDIAININYLDFNPIYDLSGNVIDKNALKSDSFNILLPKSKQDTEKAEYEKLKLFIEQEINFIVYDDVLTQIYSYNANVATDLGIIPSPVIQILNQEMIQNSEFKKFILAYFSSGAYFAKASTSDPYTEFLPLLEESEISGITPRTPYISQNFDEVLNQQMSMLVLYGVQTLILLAGLLFLTLFSAKLYCENYRKKITFSLIEGYSMLNCIKNHIALIALNYLVCGIAIVFLESITQVSMNFYLIIMAFVLEITITVLMSSKFSKAKLYEIVKGAE